MNEPADLSSDDLEPLLGRSPGLPSSSILRERVRQATTLLLRRRRQVRRLALAAALAACYVAGLFTMKWSLIQEPAVSTRDTARAEPNPPASNEVASAPEADDTPAFVLEKMGGLVDRELRAEYLRKAGDVFLEAHDLAAATRCYRKALEAMSKDQWVVAPSDNWLWIALKQARQKEARNASSDG